MRLASGEGSNNCPCAMSMQTKKILQLLRLRQINNGIFLKVRFARC